jgi:hypothetical protein
MIYPDPVSNSGILKLRDILLYADPLLGNVHESSMFAGKKLETAEIL